MEMFKQIEAMYDCVARGLGPEVIIIVSSTSEEATFWERRLRETKGLICNADARIICVDEDWPGGAGNLLGTLYAFKKAAGISGGPGLLKQLRAGKSIHMYHTAGKGMRLYPLPAVECGSKPAVKLPRILDTSAGPLPMTILEAVIFQTAIFAPSRGGRISVWWGDQVFIPSVPIDSSSRFHAEIVTQLLPVSPDMESYGLILPGPGGSVASLREKQSWGEILELVGEGGVAGKSIGSFSLSADLLDSLLGEFGNELERKEEKLDSDPHLWQPTTTTRKDYVERGGEGTYWDRISSFKDRFLDRYRGMGYLGFVDIGKGSIWWDLGSTGKLYTNLMKLVTGQPAEKEAMRRFFSICEPLEGSACGSAAISNSILLKSRVGSGIVQGSIIIDSQTDSLDVKNCIITNSALSNFKGEGVLIYGCMDDSDLAASRGEVICNVALPESGLVRIKTRLERDGKDDWDKKLPGNKMSYRRMSDLISRTGMAIMERERMAAMLKPLMEKPILSYCDERVNSFVSKPWGGSNIAILKNISHELGPIGESWEISGHPDKPTPVEYRYGHFANLADLVELFPKEVLGNPVIRKYGPRFPIIVKIIDARENLSVQVHPTEDFAVRHGLESGKMEAWLILGAEKGAKIYLGFREDTEPARFEKDLRQGNIDIAENYMNAFTARKGDVFLLPPGTLHSIGAGVTLIEIQQASGVTYRVWDWNRKGLDGRPRELHIEEALKVLLFKKGRGEDYCLKPKRIREKPQLDLLVSTEFFQAELLQLSNNKYVEERREAFCSITVLSGKGEISYGRGKITGVEKGQSYLLPARMGDWTLRSEAELEVYIARPVKQE